MKNRSDRSLVVSSGYKLNSDPNQKRSFRAVFCLERRGSKHAMSSNTAAPQPYQWLDSRPPAFAHLPRLEDLPWPPTNEAERKEVMEKTNNGQDLAFLLIEEMFRIRYTVPGADQESFWHPDSSQCE